MARRKRVEAPAPEPQPVEADDVRNRFPRGCWSCGVVITRPQNYCELHTQSVAEIAKPNRKRRRR